MDTVRRQGSDHGPPGLRLLDGERVVLRAEQLHPAAEAGEHLGEFRANMARANDNHGAWQLRELQHADVVQVTGLPQSLDQRRFGVGSGRDVHASRVQGTAAHRHLARGDEGDLFAQHDVHAEGAETLRAVALASPLQRIAHPAHYRGKIYLDRGGTDSKLRRPPPQGRNFRAADQSLRRAGHIRS